MSRFKIIRPGETLLMTEEWSDDPQWIAGETIADSGWAVGPSGPVLADSTFAGTLSTVLLSGASFGKQYTVTNIVVTSGGESRSNSTQLRCISGPSTASTFAFVDVEDSELSTVFESNVLTSAFDDDSVISVTGGQYSINGGAYTSSDGTIDSGDTFKVKATSSADYSTAVDVTLTISGVSDTFTVTTRGDTTPDVFVFTDITNAGRSTTYTSNSVSITGINQQVPIVVTGGTYSLNGGGYTAAEGSAVAGDSISVRVLSSAAFSAAINAVLTVGDLSDTFTVTTLAEDTIPDAFSFVDVSIALQSTVYESNAITVAGINSVSALSITGGTYSINGGGFTSSVGSVINGDVVSVRVTSSAAEATAVNAILTIGGVSDTYSVTTHDITPSAFSFTDQIDVEPNTAITSNSITVSGINDVSPISISGGTYSVNGGGYVSSSGTVSNGNTVTVRVASSNLYGTIANATLTIGGVADTFSATTYGKRKLFNNSVDAGGAIAHWMLNESLGASSFVDRVGGFNLTAIAGATAGVSDTLDSGVTLSGSSSKLARTQHDAGLEREWNIPSTDEAIVTPNITRSGATAAYSIGSQRDPSGSTIGTDFILQWNSSITLTQVQWLEKNASTQWRFNCDNVDLPNGTPVHLMVTQSGLPAGGIGQAKIFINGNKVTATQSAAWGSPAAPTVISATAFEMIGARGNASIVESLPGTVHERVKYNTERPQDEALYRYCLFLGRTPPNVHQKPSDPNYVIFSDDVDTDAGNIMDLLYAIAMHKLGYITLIAVCCSTKSPWGPALQDTILQANGLTDRTAIPVACYKGSAGPSTSSDSAVQATAQTDFPGLNLGLRANYPDAVSVIRQALVNVPSGKQARWYEGGPAVLLDAVATSSADGVSSLNGAALLTAKLEVGVFESGVGLTMGGSWTASAPSNITVEPVSGAAVYSDWPQTVPLLVTSGDVGNGLPSGSGGYGDLPNSTPTQPQVHNIVTSPAWAFWMRQFSGDTAATRASWGPIALNTLIFGENWTQVIGMGTLSITGSGPYNNNFTAATFSNHFWYRRRATTGLAASISSQIHTSIASIL